MAVVVLLYGRAANFKLLRSRKANSFDFLEKMFQIFFEKLNVILQEKSRYVQNRIEIQFRHIDKKENCISSYM